MTKIALLGFGVVGGGVGRVLTENLDIIEKRIGESIEIKYILDLRDFPESPLADRVIHDFNIILNDPEISIVAEMMGGSHPAYDYSKAALEAGKSVVTSNKECVSRFGVELLQVAKAHGVRYLFEASVGGGIPIIRPIMNDLVPNNIISIDAIVNGTTNYILSEMAEKGSEFATVLADAQEKGYAERNPAADVEGLDAARKIVILTALATGILIDPDSIYCEGITEIDTEIIKLASELGCKVKLIAHFEQVGGKLLAMVSPRLVPLGNPLYGVDDVFNSILLNTDMQGNVMFYGRGAGRLPTAGAVTADILDIIRKSAKVAEWTAAKEGDVADFSDYVCRRVFTFENKVGAVETLKACFGEASITDCHQDEDRLTVIVEGISEAEANRAVLACPLALISKIRML